MSVSVLSEDEYKAQEFDAVLVREQSVVCVGDGGLRMIPLSKVNHVAADEDALVTGSQLPEWFHGGGEYAFVDLDAFPDLADHLEEADSY